MPNFRLGIRRDVPPCGSCKYMDYYYSKRKPNSNFIEYVKDQMVFFNLILGILFTLALVQGIQYLVRVTNRSARLPPGPAGKPIIGNLLDVGQNPHQSLARLAKVHGPLMSLKLGRVTTIVVSSATLAREVLLKHDKTFSNRTIPDVARTHGCDNNCLPWLPVAAEWRNQRKVCNSYIFTAHKLNANEGLRRKKVQDVIDHVSGRCQDGVAVDIGPAVFKTTMNALSNTIFSLDLSDSSSDTARVFKEVVRAVMHGLGQPNLSDYFPVFRMIDVQGARRQMGIHVQKLFDLFDQLIDERLHSRKAEECVSADDMLDTLLTMSEENSEEMDIYRIKHLLLVLFVAGTDTTASTVEWSMAELLRKPKFMAKARAELEQRIGKDLVLEESEIAELPYLQAIIKETLRLHPAAPFLIPRKAGEDVELDGFNVPKGAQVLVNAWAIGRDPSLWEDPDSFVPERFLGSEIDFRGQNFELIPFGAGRRICPGLPLATRMLQMLVGSLIHSFDWKLEDGVTPESLNMDEQFGLSLQKAQPLRAVPIKI